MNVRKAATDLAVASLRIILSICRGIVVVAIIINRLSMGVYAAWRSAFVVVGLVG